MPVDDDGKVWVQLHPYELAFLYGVLNSIVSKRTPASDPLPHELLDRLAGLINELRK